LIYSVWKKTENANNVLPHLRADNSYGVLRLVRSNTDTIRMKNTGKDVTNPVRTGYMPPDTRRNVNR
jgi:hypothetical protein